MRPVRHVLVGFRLVREHDGTALGPLRHDALQRLAVGAGDDFGMDVARFATLERCDDRPGSLWLEAADVTVNASNPAFDVDDRSEYGWGGVIPDIRPWSYHSDPTLTGPREGSTLIHLIYECQKRVRNRIVVESAYAIPRDDPSLNWARRDYDHVFKLFLRNLVDSELVAADRGKDTAGRMRHYTINFGEHFWSNLIAAVRRRRRGDPEPDQRYSDFLNACAREPEFGLE